MITALVGAQFGSEGKGAVAAAYADRYQIHVRTGAPNAGHTIYFKGKKYAMQTIPCGWIDEDADLAIGPGGMIELDILRREVDWLRDADRTPAGRMYVDPRTLILDPILHGEGGVHGDAHHLIGSTGKGVGPCQMAHLSRGTMSPEFTLTHAIDHQDEFKAMGIILADVPEYLNRKASTGWNILLEGTQGSGLSSVTGPWPYTTSRDTNAGQLLVDCGLPPSMLTGVILVARTYPIRVAGNSGPMTDETTWEELGQEPEITTVTKKVRRVGNFDSYMFRYAQMLNGTDAKTALMFIDYIDPEAKNAAEVDHLGADTRDFIKFFGINYSTEVIGVGTGPQTFIKLGEPS